MKRLVKIVMLALLLIATGCTTLNHWDRTLLRDPEMQPAPTPMDKYSIGIETYREGSSGGTGSHNNTGCGCY